MLNNQIMYSQLWEIDKEIDKESDIEEHGINQFSPKYQSIFRENEFLFLFIV